MRRFRPAHFFKLKQILNFIQNENETIRKNSKRN